VSNKSNYQSKPFQLSLEHVTAGVRSGIGLNYWIEDHIGLLCCQTVEMEQMMVCLLAEIRTNQAKTDAKVDSLAWQIDLQPRKIGHRCD
jgi:hypothetical protein